MRISGGSAGGRIIKVPKSLDLRPTEERVRQALFNIIAPDIVGAEFLDLFCGTGAIGLEALSRGAAKVVFGDKDPGCLRCADEHAQLFGFLAGSWETCRGDFAACAKRLAGQGRAFDFIFLDPPYGTGDALAALRVADESALLRKNGRARIILEHERKLEVPEHAGGLRRLRQYSYGNTVLSFYAPLSEEDDADRD